MNEQVRIAGGNPLVSVVMQISHTDIAKLCTAAAATVALTLLWIHRSRQDKVQRTIAYSCKVSLRLLVLHAVAIYLFCIVCGLTAKGYLVVTAIVYIIAAAVSFESHPAASNALEFALAMGIIVPAYMLKQFVLGFPDRDLVILTPDPAEANSDPPLREDPPPRKTDTGTVVSALRPMGTIDLAGERFSATSADGTMIQAGASIRVCGNRGQLYLVAEVDTEAPGTG